MTAQGIGTRPWHGWQALQFSFLSSGTLPMNNSTPASGGATTPDPRKDSLIEYPSRFPIKVMGAKEPGFVEAVIALAYRHDPQFDEATVELRDSRAGNYQGVTITITATSREQLDDLYRALTGHPMVKVVL